MPLPAIFRTSVFRLTMLYVVMFGVSTAGLSAFIYATTVGYLERQTEEVIEAEINLLASAFNSELLPRGAGANAAFRRLVDLIELRGKPVEGPGEERFSYILIDRNSVIQAGNVRPWPAGDVVNDWIDFEVTDEKVPVRAKVLPIGTNYRILVGREIRELAAMKQRFVRALTLGFGGALLIAFAGGLALAISAQRHVVAMSRATKRIIAGDLSQRLPAIGHDEHADLARSVNSMLDQIEHLMAGLRHVGDSIAHDLRGPLTRLRTRLERLAAEEHPSKASVEECLAQADRVLATFAALLRIARVESGTYRRAFGNVDLVAIARDVAELYDATAEENLVEIRLRFDGEALVFGDRELLAQALTNLIDNALKYTPVGGHIDFEVRRSGEQVLVVVADSGPGIPAEARERVLQRFARLDASRSKPGNGLGLALVRAVCDQHEGKLVLTDNAPGLRVTISLPVATTAVAATDAAEADERRRIPRLVDSDVDGAGGGQSPVSRS